VFLSKSLLELVDEPGQPGAGCRLHKLPVIAVRAPDHENLNVGLRELLIGMSDTVPDRGSNQVNQQSYFDKKWLSHSGKSQDTHALNGVGVLSFL